MLCSSRVVDVVERRLGGAGEGSRRREAGGVARHVQCLGRDGRFAGASVSVVLAENARDGEGGGSRFRGRRRLGLVDGSTLLLHAAVFLQVLRRD